jgi:hypothetical protein
MTKCVYYSLRQKCYGMSSPLTCVSHIERGAHVCLDIFFPVYLYVVCLSVCQSVYLPVCLSVYLFVCLSVCLSLCRQVKWLTAPDLCRPHVERDVLQSHEGREDARALRVEGHVRVDVLPRGRGRL